jgi:hypothetical protein
LLENAQLRASVAEEGRTLVERRRDRDAELARVEACYRDLVTA